jgi:hypothetical protein
MIHHMRGEVRDTCETDNDREKQSSQRHLGINIHTVKLYFETIQEACCCFEILSNRDYRIHLIIQGMLSCERLGYDEF